MLGGRFPPVGVCPGRLRASSSHGAANLSISAPISKGGPDYVPSSPCDCWPPETGVQAAPKPRFRPLGRRFSVSDELSRTIAFRVRSADELCT